MTFKTFLAEQTILEGGAAIKGSHPLTQTEARDISMHAIRDIRQILNLPSNKVAAVGSAGLKAPDQLSGDIDIAVEADVTAVKNAVEQLALDGRFKHMAGLNVYSYAKLHGSKVAQVDIIPTTNLKLAKWAYYNAPEDLKKGLKGSHRNELLFAIAKFAEYKVTAKTPTGEETGRVRLVFDLSRGLYMFTQDRMGSKGLKKNFDTVAKSLLTDDPDKICERLFGKGTQAKQVMTFDDALKLMLAPSFKHRKSLKQIIDRAISGLEQKKLVVPSELRQAIISSPPGLSEAKDINPGLKAAAFELQQAIIDKGLPDNYTIKIKGPDSKGELRLHVLDEQGKVVKGINISSGGLFMQARRDAVVDMNAMYTIRAIFDHKAKQHNFKYQDNRHKLFLKDRMLVAHDEILTISVTPYNSETGIPGATNVYARVKSLDKFDEAFEFAKTCKLPNPMEPKLEKIFESQDEKYTMPWLKKLVLEVQQKIIDYGFNFKVERMPSSNDRSSYSYHHAIQTHNGASGDAAWRQRVLNQPKNPEGFVLYMPDDEVNRITDRHKELTGEYGHPKKLPISISIAVDGTAAFWFDNRLDDGNCQIAADFKLSYIDRYFADKNRYIAEGFKNDLLELQQRLLDDLPPGFDVRYLPKHIGTLGQALNVNFHDLLQKEVLIREIKGTLMAIIHAFGGAEAYAYPDDYDKLLKRIKDLFKGVIGE